MLPALVIATGALAGSVAAQEHAGHHDAPAPQAGIRAELIRDVEMLEEKYVALAEAMAGKYDYRPAEGVRSAGEVFMHVAGANFLLPTMVGVSAPESMKAGSMEEMMASMRTLEQMTDEAEMRKELAHAFTHARHAIAQVPDETLDEMVQVFGSSVSKRAALTMLVTHMHEHLGQSIAYARGAGVVPPWSAGGGAGGS
jgi:uncharacterized damage-inducible protein DinB